MYSVRDCRFLVSCLVLSIVVLFGLFVADQILRQWIRPIHTMYFVDGECRWSVSRRLASANYVIGNTKDLPPRGDESTPSSIVRLVWGLSRLDEWNSAAPGTGVSGTSIGLFGPALVGYELHRFDGGFQVTQRGLIRFRGRTIPILPTKWLVLDIGVVFSAIVVVRYLFKLLVTRFRRRNNLCTNCGYPRAAGACSECGTFH